MQGLSAAEVETIVKNYVQRHGRQGEIFRLDRPSYTAATNVSGGDSEGPLVAEAGSIIFEENETSRTAWDIDEVSEEEKDAVFYGTAARVYRL